MTPLLRPFAAAAVSFGLVLGLAMPAAAQGQTGKPSAGAWTPPNSSGAMLMKISVSDVTAVLDEAGINYEITSDNAGDPLITADGTAALVGERMAVFFYDCDINGCEDIRMYSYFKTRKAISLEVINDFNRDKRWGRAFFDDDRDPVLELDINATGGIGREALRILINTYLSSMNDFAAHVGAR